MFIDQFKLNTTSSSSRRSSERDNELYGVITRDTNCALSCSFDKKSIINKIIHFDHMQMGLERDEPTKNELSIINMYDFS